MPTKRTLQRQLTAAQQQRATAYEARDEALKDADGARFTVKRLAQQIDEARDELDALRKKPAPTPGPASAAWVTERQTLRRALLLCERGRRALDDRARALHDANDALCREAVDRAGNLARTEAAR